jgi:hypothetical protein
MSQSPQRLAEQSYRNAEAIHAAISEEAMPTAVKYERIGYLPGIRQR